MNETIETATSLAASAASVTGQRTADHTDTLKWTAGPPGFPPGAHVAVLTGDLKGDGPFVVRFKAPAGYKIPAHTHPDDEHVTVLSGAFHIVIGDDLQETKGQVFKAGGYSHVPAGTPHLVWFSEESVTQVHGMGPPGITYLNPADDPRRK